MSSILAQSHFPATHDAWTKKLIKASGQGIKGYAIPLFLGAHIPLALMMDRSSTIGILHCLATLGIGLWCASGTRRSMERVAYVGAYITGAEVLWRMSEAGVFWEIGKYATAAIFFIAIIRRGNWNAPALPFLYFALLLPSVAITLMKEGPVDARLLISGNISGPLAMMMSIWFFSRVTLSVTQVRTLFLAVIGPTIGVATIAASSTLSTSDIAFGNESNFVTSGGFGPNQVSAALGLGALLALLYVLTDKRKWTIRTLMLAVTIWLATQSALTFSRGGLYTAAGGAVLGILYLSRDSRARVKIILLAVLLFIIVSYVVLPRLDAFTGGAFSDRFENTDSTGRNTIAQADLQIWAENPVFGIGVGESKTEHARYYRRIATHTEYTRLLAEHGLFGLVAGLLLLVMAAQRFVSIGRMRDVRAKAMIAPMAVWALLYMVDKAMRLVAPSFAFGLCFLSLRQRRRLIRVIRYEKYEPTLSQPKGPAPLGKSGTVSTVF